MEGFGFGFCWPIKREELDIKNLEEFNRSSAESTRRSNLVGAARWQADSSRRAQSKSLVTPPPLSETISDDSDYKVSISAILRQLTNY
jgi:hypothetical protein